jgi:hypothetical protein
MEVDLKKLSAGDTVNFKCGGTAVIERIEKSGEKSKSWYIVFAETSSKFGVHYTADGRIYRDEYRCGSETPFNIVGILK